MEEIRKQVARGYREMVLDDRGRVDNDATNLRYVDLAVAQAAAAAALWVTAGQEHPDLPTTQAAAAAGALACVGLVAALTRRWPQQREALIGLVYSLAGVPHAALLSGAILGLTPVAALMFRFNNPDALLVLALCFGPWVTATALRISLE